MAENDFDSMHNFRRIPGTILFRSAKTDKATASDIEYLQKLDIKSILDFRSFSIFEQKYASGEHLIDGVYEPIIISKQDKTDGVYGHKTKAKHQHVLFNTCLPCISKIFERNSFLGKCLFVMLGLLTLIDKLIGKVVFKKLLIKYFLNPIGLVGTYTDFIEVHVTEICMGLRILSDKENVPSIICCHAGKDRTGMVVAIILGVLRTEKQEIMDDYAKSKLSLEDQQNVKNYDADKAYQTALPDSMNQFLNYIDTRYGSVSNYLVRNGFTEEDQRRLVRNIKL